MNNLEPTTEELDAIIRASWPHAEMACTCGEDDEITSRQWIWACIETMPAHVVWRAVFVLSVVFVACFVWWLK